MIAEEQLVSAKGYPALPEQHAFVELIREEIVVQPPLTPEHQDILANLRDFLNEIARVRGFGRRYFAPDCRVTEQFDGC